MPTEPVAIIGPQEPALVNGELVSAVRSKLAEYHLEMRQETANHSSNEKREKEKRLILLVSMNFKQLCIEAEHEGLMKELSPEKVKDSPDSLQFKDPATGAERAKAEFRRSHAVDFLGFSEALEGTCAFFEPWEVQLLVLRRLSHVEADGCLAITCPQKRERLVDALVREASFEGVMALHETSVPWSWGFPCSFAGLDEIHSTFGDGIAAYFVFMRTFTLWLIPLAVVALLLKIFRRKGSSIDTSTEMPLYEVLVVLWAAAFPALLDRAAAHFAFRWGRLHAKAAELPRPEFYGDLIRSPITGEEEITYASWKRGLKYAISALVTSVLLFVAFCVMIVSLNFQGYVHNPKLSAARGLEVTFGSVFLVEPIAELTEPGQIFDPSGVGDPFLFGYITYVPVILHSVVITQLNKAYRKVAGVLTEWENHRTQQEFMNSMILKRFLFEAFDCYIALFYIAFYERDVGNLRSELISLFHIDVLRRVALETVVPLVQHYFTQWKQDALYALQKKDDDSKPELEPVGRAEKQLELEEHEEFDEYLEMVIQFGYIALFAGLFPMSSVLAIICNAVEVCSDSFKLRWAYRKPFAYAASGMPETWHLIIGCMCWLSILTNVLTFGYVSEQALHVFQNSYMFEKANGPTGDHRVKALGVWILLLIENVMLASAAFIKRNVRSRPRWVRNSLDGREYRRARIAKAALKARFSS